MNPTSGGPGQGIRNNLPFWRSNGLEATVLCFDDPKEEFANEDYIIALGPPKNNWAYVPKLQKWLLAHLSDFDVVLIHGLWLYNGYAVTNVIKQLKKDSIKVPKVFVMPHGMLDPYFQKAPERRLKAIRNIVYWHLIEKYVINNADGILFTCAEELELAKTTFNCYTPRAVYNVGYGIIAPPIFTKEQLQAFHSKCPKVINKSYFLFLSRIHQKKGVDILIESYATCYNHFAKKNIVLPDLVIAGPGMETDYGRHLITLLTKYPLVSEKIHFPGMLHGDAKWGALYGAELFVLPSHQENFGIAIVEAMACKTPVLISNKVNIWREIYEGNAGLITDDTTESVTKKLIEWIELKQGNKLFKNNSAYDTYLNYFTSEATSNRFIEVVLKK